MQPEHACFDLFDSNAHTPKQKCENQNERKINHPFGNVVFDYDENGELIKLEILDFNLEKLTQSKTKH